MVTEARFTAEEYRDAKAGIRRCPSCSVPMELDDGLETGLCDWCHWIQLLGIPPADDSEYEAWLDQQYEGREAS